MKRPELYETIFNQSRTIWHGMSVIHDTERSRTAKRKPSTLIFQEDPGTATVRGLSYAARSDRTGPSIRYRLDCRPEEAAVRAFNPLISFLQQPVDRDPGYGLEQDVSSQEHDDQSGLPLPDRSERLQEIKDDDRRR